MHARSAWNAVSLLALVGVALSLYLLWQQVSRPAWQPCSLSTTVNCDAVISGPVARTFGIPTPLIGLIGYIVIWVSSRFQKRTVLLATALFGLAFCLRIAYIELVELSVVCPVCIACQIVMAAVTLLAARLRRQ